MTLLIKPRSAISSSSAPVPRDWLRQCMALQKDLTFWCWKRVRLAARQVQAQESKITWDFPPVSQARARSSGIQPGAEVRRGDTHSQGHATRLRPQTIHRRSRERGSNSGTHYRDCDRSRVSKTAIENLSRFEGAGVYYGATFVEAQSCDGEEVIVVGGGNSAGQAAVFLAERTKRVHMLIRSEGLAESMSRYLIRRIKRLLRSYRPNTEIVALEGGDHLESVRWRNSQTGQTEEHKIGHVFVMTGADPNTRWLNGCVALDTKGFIKTGPDLLPENLNAAGWPLARQPYLLETSLPGVFAVGDVRGGSIKRVASAVGEGSIAISFVHEVLQE